MPDQENPAYEAAKQSAAELAAVFAGHQVVTEAELATRGIHPVSIAHGSAETDHDAELVFDVVTPGWPATPGRWPEPGAAASTPPTPLPPPAAPRAGDSAGITPRPGAGAAEAPGGGALLCRLHPCYVNRWLTRGAPARDAATAVP